MAPLRIGQSVNSHCPWPGLPVKADSLTRYRGHVVGVCNPGCRDRFDTALAGFDRAIDALGTAGTANSDKC